MRKTLLLLLSACLLLTGCGIIDLSPVSSAQPESASPSQEDVSQEPSGTLIERNFTLCLESGDSLNPYRCSTRTNLELSGLLYRSLVRLSPSLEPQKELAQEITLDGLACTVTLKEGQVFSDGSPVTAADVVYSYNLAKGSAAYQARFAGVKSAAAAGNGVVFTLAAPNRNFVNLLDFPILKNGTGEEGAVPVGGGLYVYQAAQSQLTANPQLSGDEYPNIEPIYLTNVPDSDTLIHALDMGMVSMLVMEPSQAAGQRVSSVSEKYLTTNLVFAGINLKSANMRDVNIRKAVNAAVGREELAKKAFLGFAEPAVTPFYPAWQALDGLTLPSTSADLTGALSYLSAAGYQRAQGATEGLVLKNRRTLPMKVLVNSDNEARVSLGKDLVSQLQKAGIDASLTELSFEEYSAAIQKGNYDLYIGEIRLTADMNLEKVLPAGEAANAYSQYQKGEMDLQAFLTAFSQEQPMVPLCYRQGAVAFTRDLKGTIAPAFSDPYRGAKDWTFGG